jgi:enoyl-CoA hydratase
MSSDTLAAESTASLRVERSPGHLGEHVSEVVLTGPGKGNALGPDFWRDIPAVFARLDADPSVRVVLIRGSGSCFTYGLDLPAMLGGGLPGLLKDAPSVADRAALLDTIRQMQGSLTAVEACRKPVVAAVHGWCIGGGVGLIAACDVRLCSADARFSVREVRLAIVPDIGPIQRLPRIIGEGMTRRLAMTGEDFDSARAERIGLVSDVYPDEGSLLVAARDLCGVLAGNSPLAVQGIKQILNASRDLPQGASLEHVAVWNSAFLPSGDLREAVTAFMEKRQPRFQGT